MKSLILFALLASTAAFADIIEVETLGRCGFSSLTKPNHGGLADVAHTSVVPFKFPQTSDFTIDLKFFGPRTFRYGSGKVSIAQNVEILNAQGQLVSVPVQLSIEIQPVAGNPGRKTIFAVVEEFPDVFRGTTVRNKVIYNREIAANDSFLYPEFAVTTPNYETLPVGNVAQIGVICPLLNKDQLGND